MTRANSHDEEADREARRRMNEQAEQLGHVVFSVSIRSPATYYASYGTMPPECGEELITLLDRWGAEGRFGKVEREVG